MIHSAFYPGGTRGYFVWGKAAGKSGFPITSPYCLLRQEYVELCLHIPLCLHDVVRN